MRGVVFTGGTIASKCGEVFDEGEVAGEEGAW